MKITTRALSLFPRHTWSISLLCTVAALARLPAAELEIGDATEFKKLIAPDAKLTKLAGDMKFTEGPVWLAQDGGYLVFSDIPANELKQWTAKGGLKTFRQPSQNANGNTLDRTGKLVTCEHSSRRVSIQEKDGAVRTLVDRFDGKKFNSPNDAVVKSDGTIWFTDPPYGLPKGETKEQAGNYVYRFDPKTKTTTLAAKEFDMPNGLCFSPDEKQLYVADSGKPRHIRVFDVQPDGALAGGALFCQIDTGGPDGIRCDTAGRVFSSAGDGVHIFSPEGKLIGKILVPEAPANLCFGGPDGRILFITARTSLYSIPLLVTGAR
jgi:gluconolactonase